MSKQTMLGDPLAGCATIEEYYDRYPDERSCGVYVARYNGKTIAMDDEGNLYFEDIPEEYAPIGFAMMGDGFGHEIEHLPENEQAEIRAVVDAIPKDELYAIMGWLVTEE